MKANRDDAPEWLTSRPRKSGNLGVVLAGVIGMVITLGALTVAGQAFMQTTVKNLSENRQQPKPKPVAEITRAEPAPSKDWDLIVDQQARRDAMSQQPIEQPTSSESPAIKQTMFNDENYTPRGADNVLSLRESYQPVEPEKPAGKVKVTVIKEEQKLKDWACWGKEGSIERRNCKTKVGLNYRN
ncbi:hypothetical protein SAMN05216601_102317 [Ectopseudomonas composti]|jgi:hypothetical protein|uniref:Uncharacterized protein n=1 Tax=Ectopseudomonas composti TaxID=658457 RepID=A0A1I5KBA0_9GAMM|nr:hypothetical protein [Pseudomonas composti]SFO81866.1 hypothetical protein SAMN05216601_102317 [Pseudomonas composti]